MATSYNPGLSRGACLAPRLIYIGTHDYAEYLIASSTELDTFVDMQPRMLHRGFINSCRMRYATGKLTGIRVLT